VDQCKFAGDREAKLEAAHPFVLDPTDTGGVVLIEPKVGEVVPLRQPVQGGFVLYAGALFRNLDPCQVTLRAQLREASTGNVISNLDVRQADLEPAPAPHEGWWRPRMLDSLSTVPNIPVCPDALGFGADGQPAVIELIAIDRENRTVKLEHPVTPTCPTNELVAECRCTCGPHYFPGKCTNLDMSGISDGGDGGG
jgi:hypothetical protein